MKTSIELRQERAKILSDAKKLINDNPTINGEVKQQLDAMYADVDAKAIEINAIEKMEGYEASLATPATSITSTYFVNSPLQNICKTKEEIEKDAFKYWCQSGFDKMPAEYALSITSNGGSTGISPALAAIGFVDYLRWFSPVLQAPITKVITDGGQDLPYPVTDDTGNTGATTTEGSGVASNVDLSTSAITMKAYNFDSNILVVSKQLLQDSAILSDEFILNKLAERCAVKANGSWTTGNGTTAPQGIVTGATAQTAGGTTTAFASGTAGTSAYVQALRNSILGLIHSIGPAYRNHKDSTGMPTTGFMCKDSTILHLRTQVLTTGEGFWEASTVLGQPDRLFNYPVYPNSDMDAIGASKKSLIFGDFSQFYVRLVRGDVTFERFNELYGATRQVGFLAWMRTDSKVMNPNAISAFVHVAS